MKKRVVSLVLVLCMCLGLVPVGATQADVWDGSIDTAWANDTSQTEFVIETAEELAGLASLVNNGNSFSGKTIKLASDIDLGGLNWTPIGRTANDGKNRNFEGTFNGAGHSIFNLKITDSTLAHIGLFGKISNATIENVTVNGQVNASVRAQQKQPI